MTSAITIISTRFVLNVFVNCYLVRAGNGFVLIDTGMSNKRGAIERALASAGCPPGNLKLILLTHGDFDHCGNAAYLRKKFDTIIAMHADDVGIVQRGDMFWNRKKPNALVKLIFGSFFGLRQSNRFEPDVCVRDGYSLSAYGFDAKIVHVPGHSRGSTAIMTAEGDLFCGDLLGNTNKPELWSIMDDMTAAKASLEKLKRLKIKTVYPGHGKPFPMDTLII